VVGGIQSDLSNANILGVLVSVDRHAVAICNGTVVGLLGGLAAGNCSPAVTATGP
jgi:hypothetical protein